MGAPIASASVASCCSHTGAIGNIHIPLHFSRSRFQSLASTSSAFASTHSPCTLSSLPRPAGTRRLIVLAGNPGSNGPFAPLVRTVRNAMGAKEFNKFRGKAISLHSQVIKDFCKQIGADTKQVQGLIRLAKKNGEKLGFLA